MEKRQQQQEKKSERKNYPAHIVRKKETKPRKPGGGRKPGQKDTKPRKPEEKPRKPGGGRKPALDRTRTLTLKVKSSWWAEHKALADAEGVSMAEHCRKLLHADLK